MLHCTLGEEKNEEAKVDAPDSATVSESVADGAMPPPKKPKKKMSTARKWLWTLFVITGIYGIWLLVGGFWLPPFTRDTLQEVLREKFRTEATVGHVTFNPFTFNLVIHDLAIPNPDGSGVLFSCKALDFSPSATGVLDLAPGLAHAKLIEPVVDVTYFGGGRFSFSEVLDSMLAESADVEDNTAVEVAENGNQSVEPEPIFPFVVTDFELVNGAINYKNTVLDVEHHITDINFFVPFTSTIVSDKEKPITPTLSAKINGSVMQVEGNTLPFTDDFATTFNITTDDISLSPFKKYIHDYSEFDLVDGSAKFLLHFGVRRLSNANIELGFGGSLFVNNFALQSPKGETVASLKSGELAVKAFTLAERRLSLDHVDVDGLYVKACKGLDGVIDWQTWIADAKKNFESKNASQARDGKSDTANSGVKNTEETKESAFIVEGATLSLTNSKIVWRDESLVADKEIALTNINVLVPNFNTGDGGYAAYDVKFGINDSGLVSIAGDATMEPATATARLKVKDIPLQVGRPFLGHSLISDVQGLLGGEGLVTYGTSLLAGEEVVSVAAGQDKDAQAAAAKAHDTRDQARQKALSNTSDMPPVIVESASMSIRNFSMGRAGNAEAKPLVSFASATLSGVEIDAIKHRITATELALSGPVLTTTLNRMNEPMVKTVDGWVKAVAYGKTKEELKAQELADKKAAQSSAKKSTAPMTASGAIAASPLKDWTAELKTITMADGQLHVDMVRGNKHKILPVGSFSGMTFKAGPVTLDMSKSVNFDFATRWQEKGHVQLAGKLIPEPLDVNMTIKAKQMDLSPFDGLVSSKMNLQMAGFLQTDMKCQVRVKPKTSTPLITMSGNANVQNVAFKEFGTSDNFFSLRNFDVKNFAVDSEKMKVKVGAVKVQSPYLSIKMDKYGVTNAERAVMPEAAEAKYQAAKTAEKTKKTQASKKQSGNQSEKKSTADTAQAEADTKEIVSRPPDMIKFSSFVMDGITVTGGSALFEDARQTPPFRLRTTAIDATCTNFSLAPDSRSNVNVTAIVGGAPFAMHGSMNPVTIPPFADMVANVENMNLVPMTPYSLEYIAYPIEKGSLTAEMAVKTGEWKLDADTEFVLNNFELGDYDSRPDAPSYPVKLGLSLLRGLDGSVSIDLPVQGRLDDPNFRVGGVVVKAITNLMLRVVTSPFALLGGILSLATGDDTEDTELVPFTAGQIALDVVAQRRAKAMIELLQKRPSLTVRIDGDYDETSDGHMLCLMQLVKPMKQRKYNTLSPREQVATDVDDIVIDPNEYDQFLHERYIAETGARANAEGEHEMATREEMEEYFLKDMTASPRDFQKLAQARAQAVKAHMLEIAPELKGRVFANGDADMPKTDFAMEGEDHSATKTASQARFILQ